MLIKKTNTPYGYNAKIRYDTKNPTIHVIQPKSTLTITGEATITVITGTISTKKQNNNDTNNYEQLTDKETNHTPKELNTVITNNSNYKTAVILEDNNTRNNLEEYLKLTTTEEDPSADDLNYIEDN